MKIENTIEWELDTRGIDEIYQNFKNPRKMGKKQTQLLKSSLGRFGLCQPIVINRDGTIIGGHQRFTILREMGYKRILVMVPSKEYTSQDADDLAILLNKIHGTWDHDLLANHWDPEKLLELGFSQEELHLEQIPEQEKIPTKFEILIKCTDQEELEMVERQITPIIDDFAGASYKVKIR